MDLKEKEEIRRIVRDETRREYKRLKEKEKDKKERDTQELMKQYRNAVFHMEKISTEAGQIQKELPAAGISSYYMDILENANTSTRIMLRNINNVLTEIEQRRRSEGRQQEYRAFQLYYLEGLTYEKVKDKLEAETGEQLGAITVKRWCDKILNELSVLLWGI